jgi:mannose-6-phosphate isomerase-like protein (cupin superfamily)
MVGIVLRQDDQECAMRWILALTMGAAMSAATLAMGQSSPGSNAAPAAFPNLPGQADLSATLAERGKKLLARAATSADGSASEVLNRYPGYYTMLVARVRSGQVEQHAGYEDFFFVLDGELTEIVGGKTGAMKEVSPGESRASAMEGGNPSRLRLGDVMHIAVNVPHQTTVPAGKTVVYYVIKVGVKK